MAKTDLTAGEIIFNSTVCLKRAVAEIEAMIKHFAEDLEDCLFNARIIKKNGLIEEDSDSEEEPHEWLTLGIVKNYGLVPPPNHSKNPKACIGIKVALAEQDENKSGIIKEPLIHVLYCGGEDAEWEYDEYVFPPILDEDDDGYKAIIRSGRLVEWYHSDQDENTILDWKDRQWAFSLPLVAINTLLDIRKQICEPIVDLIKGKDPEAAFKEGSKVLNLESVAISADK